MRKLIRKILREQEEEEFVFPEYKNPDEPIFTYLDKKLNGLVKRKPEYYEGIVFAYPDKKYGVLGWDNDGTLCIEYELIEEISNRFGLEKSDSKSVIGRWFSDRYKLEVTNIATTIEWGINVLATDKN